MISAKMSDLLNLQMNREFFNNRLYLSMATYFYSINLDGFARWMEQQAQEETGHAMRLYKHLQERGARILVAAVPAPPTEWKSPQAAFEDAYAHECKVSEEFNELVAEAQAVKDNATLIFLQWFVTEQVEEEANVDAVIQKLKMAKGSTGALLMLDSKLGARGK
ncbi:MAG: ferritin [Lentisphaeria bacterium]